jgi:hypothetical protein
MPTCLLSVDATLAASFQSCDRRQAQRYGRHVDEDVPNRALSVQSSAGPLNVHTSAFKTQGPAGRRHGRKPRWGHVWWCRGAMGNRRLSPLSASVIFPLTSDALPTSSTIDSTIVMPSDRRFWPYAHGLSSSGKTLHRHPSLARPCRLSRRPTARAV